MNILILFATYSGGTQTAAQIVETELKNAGHTVTLSNPAEINFEAINGYDIILMGSPSWEHEGQDGQPHIDFMQFMSHMQDKTFDNKKFAIFGLGDSSYAHFCGAVDHLEEFVKKAKGLLVVESLRIDGFFVNQEKYTQELTAWSQKIATSV